MENVTQLIAVSLVYFTMYFSVLLNRTKLVRLIMFCLDLPLGP